MQDRRLFLKKSAVVLVSLSMPIVGSCNIRQTPRLTAQKPEKIIVFWYSQTGNTQRAGRVIARTLEKKGLSVLAGEYREIDPSVFCDADMVIGGSPVYYYDVPANFKKWIQKLPDMKAIPSAAYVTFGGTGGNQHNTVCTLSELLMEKGTIPVGMDTFGNMASFALTWSSGNSGRVLKYKHLPDETSYKRMQNFALASLERVYSGVNIEIDKDFDFRNLIKNTPSIWSTKLFISRHTIDPKKCIDCGTCVAKCPVGAIDLAKRQVDTNRCIACLGCVNNCPASAVDMVFMGKKVYGYYEFLRRNQIKIYQPDSIFI